MTNPAYSAPDDIPRSATDGIPPADVGVGGTALPAIGDRVKHRISGQVGELVDYQADPFVKDLTHGIVNWVGDGDGFGQGYASTNLIKF